MADGGLFDLDPNRILAYVVAILIAITVHEFMHAWTAWRLGDDTARNLGRITLNPAAHFDPLGFILFLFIVLFPGAPLIAWGKPVPVNVYRLRPAGRLGQRGSMGVVALAGPVSNLVLAAVTGLPYLAAYQRGADLGWLDIFLPAFIQLNLGLAAFNMIPIPPLDGSKILFAILPNFWYVKLAPLERYGFGLVFVLIIADRYLNAGVIGAMIAPFFLTFIRILGLSPLFF